jgi:hypothetical protein
MARAKRTTRTLKGRRRRASKGRHFRVSDLVYKVLDKQRHGLSWDSMMRRMLGLPDRNGAPQPLVEGVLEVHTGTFILKGPDVPWPDAETIAHRIALRADYKRHIHANDRPVRMRELR